MVSRPRPPPSNLAPSNADIIARIRSKYSRSSLSIDAGPTKLLEGATSDSVYLRKGKERLIDHANQEINERRHFQRTKTVRRRKRELRLVRRDEGAGGPEGIVLPMEMLGGGIYDASYTIPVRVGASQQNLSVQVDSGSSDLWFASTSCSTRSCSQTSGRLYDPSSSRPTGQQFDIPYLRGRASGPIVWDRLEVGGYSVENQALAAADNVDDEPLAPQFVGILGLALPINSIIASTIPPGTSNAPDGQTLPPNLFSITPRQSAPSYRFFSLSLSRPGADYPPSLLGIGRHPTAIRELHRDNDTSKEMDLSKVEYSTLVSERTGILFWKVDVRGITVWVDGEAREVTLGRGVSGSPWPTAVIDSGVPLILTTSTIANAIYGAIGVNPASDGQYYVPCKTPLNLTLILDDRPPMPLHPLDLTGEPPRDNNAQFCIGLIQSADAFLLPSGSNPTSSNIGDMILGVPFMRNVYTVMSYDPPDANGVMPNTTLASAAEMAIRPRLGLLGLTDARIAMEEFQRVRVAHQPLTTGSPSGNSSNQAPGSGGGKISVGIAVLIGLVSFFALCFVLFGIRWFITRRRWRKASAIAANEPPEGGEGMMKRSEAYQLARTGSMELTALGIRSSKAIGHESLTEEELRTLRYNAYVKKERIHSEYTMSSGRTLAAGETGSDADGLDDFGVKRHGGEEVPQLASRSNITLNHADVPRIPHNNDAEDDELSSWNGRIGTDWEVSDNDDDTAAVGAIIGGGVIQQPRSPTRDRHHRRSASAARSSSTSPARRPLPKRNRTTSELYEASTMPTPRHDRTRSISSPLLQNTHPNLPNFQDAAPYRSDPEVEFGMTSRHRPDTNESAAGAGIAGVGTSARLSRIDPLPEHSTNPSYRH